MYQVAIVEDDMLSRIGLKALIPWEEHGYELIGEYENGRQALEAFRVNSPDIAIIDIKMPVMDGVELLRALKEEGIRAKCIVLSAYDDYEYVREALRIGAVDYFLKMQMEPDSLLELLDLSLIHI